MEVLYSVSAGAQVKILGRQILKKKTKEICFELETDFEEENKRNVFWNLRSFLVAGRFSAVHQLLDEVSGEEGRQLQQERMWD